MTAETDFSEGMALGLLMCGHASMPNGSKPTVELAFARAWRRWPYCSRFGFVGSDRRQDEWYQITHARKGTRTWNLYWDRDTICYRQSDPEFRPTAEEVAESISDSIPATAWRDLVVVWLAELSS